LFFFAGSCIAAVLWSRPDWYQAESEDRPGQASGQGPRKVLPQETGGKFKKKLKFSQK